MDRLASLFGRRRGLLTCLVLAMTGACLFGLSRVTLDNDPLRLFRSKKFEFKELKGDFAHLEQTGVIVVEGEDLLTPGAVEGLRRISEAAAAVDGVQQVHSMLDVRDNRRVGRLVLPLFPSSEASPERFERVKSRAPGHPLLTGHFLSEDRKTSLVTVQFEAGVTGFAEVKAILARLQAALDESAAGTGLRTRITGTRAIEVEIVQNMRRDIFKFSFLGVSMATGIAILMFRRPGAAFLVVSGPAVGTIWTIGTLGLLGEPINILTNVVPVLVLVIGYTDSMHLVLHVRRALASGASGLEAAQSCAIRQLGLACLLTSISTAVGFSSLLVASLEGIRTFGWCCALGSVMSFLAVITVVPLLASTRLSRYVVADQAHRLPRGLERPAEGMLSWIIGHARLVVAGGIVVIGLFALGTSRLQPDHTIRTEVPDSSEVYEALEHLDTEFGGVMFAYAVVEWPDSQRLDSPEVCQVLEEVHRVFDEEQMLRGSLSVLNVVRSLPGEEMSLPRRTSELRYVPEEHLARLVSFEQRRAVVSAHMQDVGARFLKPALDDAALKFDDLARAHPGFRIELRGKSVAVFRNIHIMIEDLWKSLATASGVMFLMILIGLRSLRFALASLLPNVFPLLATGVFILLTGRYLEITSVIVFSISLGIAVDDTIHFLVRFQREMQSDADPIAAVRRTFHVVGEALVMTTVVLVAGHAIVMTSSFPTVRMFGMLAAVTIASALIGDLILLPAILVSLRWPKNKRPSHSTAIR